MNFLYPQLLFGLFALTIPIIIHLFNFRRTKRVYFSNTQFLKKVKEASSSKLKLKHYLILLSRLLFILFLILAFAQPYLPAENEGFASNKVIIYLDNSLSMSNETDENLTAFEQAIQFVNKVVAIYPAATQYKLITNEFAPSANVFKTGAEVTEMLTETDLTGIIRSSSEVANRIAKNDQELADIFWLSDMQQSTIGADVVELDSTFDVNLISLPFTGISNVFIDSVYLQNPFLLGGEQLKLTINLANKGLTEKNDLNIKVFIDDRQAATAVIDIGANDTYSIDFDLKFNLDQITKGKVVIEEFPVIFDNELFFTINTSKKVKVLEVKDTNSSNFVAQVYANQQLFDFKSFEITNIDFSQLESADLVILNGVSKLNMALAAAINQRLSSGRQVLLIPAETPDLESYKQIAYLNALEMIESTEEIVLNTPDFDNPFFAQVFEEKSTRFAMPAVKPVLKLPVDRNAILAMQNGRPFLSQPNQALYVATAPFQSGFGNFTKHALFVPVMYRMAALSMRNFNKLYYFVDDDYINFDTDTLLVDQVFKLTNQAMELIPAQRKLNQSVLLEVPKYALNAGFYDLTYNNKVVSSLAFNTSPKESDLRQLADEDVLKQFKGKLAILSAADEAAFGQAIENKYIGEPLWKYAIVLALLFLLIEVLLVRFFP